MTLFPKIKKFVVWILYPAQCSLGEEQGDRPVFLFIPFTPFIVCFVAPVDAV